MNSASLWKSFRSRVAADLNARIQLLNMERVPVDPATFEIRQKIDWKEGGYMQGFQYNLWHKAPSAEYRSSKWMVNGKMRLRGSPHQPLGYIEIHALLATRVTVEVLLRLMVESVQRERGVRLAYEVYPEVENNSWVYVERMVARTLPPLGEVIGIFGERKIPQRSCTSLGCGAFLPAVCEMSAFELYVRPHDPCAREGKPGEGRRSDWEGKCYWICGLQVQALIVLLYE
ncbi:hypothetical protein B0H15DRAFT_436091 [Mycena belliarum]|uniref:Uncharacterized protein n=1 Tax=Mycena belliarum TaxID=1033014 RepID=A0AAD6XJA6_9AGAR|nr:hypothetical protein B0H15DRAFT_436091 [Mycena belliae]